ncbi:hypothetical protein A9CBEGH2_05350 [Amedibacterium intestinale]|nr:hypothetical protein A9CBEGH2_05350 [Amedibacterium intestinale]
MAMLAMCIALRWGHKAKAIYKNNSLAVSSHICVAPACIGFCIPYKYPFNAPDKLTKGSKGRMD